MSVDHVITRTVVLGGRPCLVEISALFVSKQMTCHLRVGVTQLHSDACC